MAVVTDQQVAALRAYLAGGSNERVRLHEQLLQSDGLNGYGELVHTAFVTAVRRRFAPIYTRSDVIRFVADIRVLLSERPDAIHPCAGENLIRRALGEPIADDIDQETRGRTEIVLLAVLIKDEELDDAGLDEFLGSVRTLTGQWWPA
jgi:hypothetical protein